MQKNPHKEALSFEEIIQFRKNAESAMQAEENNNKNFKNYWQYTFENCLTEEDKSTLTADGKDTLSFNSLRTYVLHYMRNVKDSSASVSFSTDTPEQMNDNPQLTDGQIVDVLNKKYDHILDRSQYDDVEYGVALDACVGGKGIFYIKSDYVNQYDFKQTIFIEKHPDPTLVFFDPCSKKPSKEDSDFVLEKIVMKKSEFNRTFPDLDFDRMKKQYNSGKTGFSWAVSGEGRTAEEVIYICDYYYKVYDSEYIYELKDGSISYDKPSSSKTIVNKRKVENCRIWRVRFCGEEILKDPAQTNFTSFPFVMAEAEGYVKDGVKKLIPYAKHGFDAVRTKTFLLNYYVNHALENNKGTIRVAEEAITDQLIEAARNPGKGNIQVYKAFTEIGGDFQALPPVQDVPPLPLPQQLLEAAGEIDQSLNNIFGMQFPSTDETNMSGKALYNLAQFMSASNEVLMQNLYLAVSQVATTVLGAMVNIYEKEEILLNEKSDNPEKVSFDYIFEPSRYNVDIKRGVSHKLQQEATIERMMSMAQVSPTFAQFINSPQTIEYLLENQDLNNKDQILKLWEEFSQEMKQQSQQQAQNPQAQAAQQSMEVDMQAKTTTANAKMMDAQTRAKQANLEEMSLIYDQSNRKQDKKLDLFNTVSENRRDHEKNQIKVAELNTRNKHFLINKVTGGVG